jgi:hypothetical protein
VRRTGSSEDGVPTTKLLDLQWADGSGPADEFQNTLARTDGVKKGSGTTAARQSSLRADSSRQAAAPLTGRPMSQPASLGPMRDSGSNTGPGNIKTPDSPQSKPMLALLSAAFPEATSDDLTLSAIQLCDALSPLKHIGLAESETGEWEGGVEEHPGGTDTRIRPQSSCPVTDTCARPSSSDATSSPITAPIAPDGDVSATRLRDKFVVLGSSTGHSIYRPTSRPSSREGLYFGAENSADVTADDMLTQVQLNREILNREIDRGTIRPNSMLRQKSAAVPEAHDSHSSAAPISTAQRNAAHRVKNISRSESPAYTYDEVHQRADAWEQSFAATGVLDSPSNAARQVSAWEQSFAAAGAVDSPSNAARQLRRQGASLGGRGWTKARTSGGGLESGVPPMSRPLSQPASREGLLALAVGLAGFSDSEGLSSGPKYDEVRRTHTSGTYGAVGLRGSTWMPSKGLHNSMLRREGRPDSNPDTLDDWAWVGDAERSRLLYESPVMTTINYARQEDRQHADLRPATAHQLLHDPNFPARSAAAAEARREQLRQVGHS